MPSGECRLTGYSSGVVLLAMVARRIAITATPAAVGH
jgi:hypothetical protein